MISRARDLFKRMSPLLQELETYSTYKDLIVKNVKAADSDYQKKRISFAHYQKALHHYLSGKSLKEVVEVYDNYINHVKGQLKVLNSHILKEVYEDSSFVPKVIKPVPAPPEKFSKPTEERIPEKKGFSLFKKRVKQEKQTQEELQILQGTAKEELPEIKAKPIEKKQSNVEFLKEKPVEKDEITIPKKKAKQRIESEESIAGIELPQAIKRKLAERTFLSDKTVIPENLVEMETLRRKARHIDIKAKIDPELLEQNAKRIVAAGEKKVVEKAYKPSVLGGVANLFVRKIGYFFIKRYPELFEKLYTGLRLANIGTLSNTYVNIMIFLTLLAFIGSSAIFFFFFLFTTFSFGELFIKTFAMGLMFGLLTLTAVYYYPFMKIKQRAKNINANLPFVVNHMGAISSSGLPPDMMFRLVSQTKEYGELSVELSKVVDYIDLFGYDLITAVDTVATNTPSPVFKDLLEGMITSIESGGDLKGYFTEKTDEIMSSYRLEKDKNIKIISTYSDIYTGIMVSAPLFFISVLALVSILGGNIGGVSVHVVITVGTYVVIPLINIGFLVFLSVAQPEV